MTKPKVNAWVYKCNLNYPRKGEGYSFLDPDQGFLATEDHDGVMFGGEDWIRSGAAWTRLGKARSGDLVFCHQTDLKGLVGVTVAASGGYPDPDGSHPDKCSAIDLGPGRVKFETTVRIADVRSSVGNLNAYSAGLSRATFVDVEPRFAGRLIDLCMKMNPAQKREIRRLLRRSDHLVASDQENVPQDNSAVIKDPIRREMLIEAYERRASWAKDARRVYGYSCMVPGCKFKLVKEDGDLFIEVHHLKAMCHGGSPNDRRNMCVLCPNHHREVHFGTRRAINRLERLLRKRQAELLESFLRRA
ncbi:MAG: hypothetical protein WD768_05925 [Phycisphaeraceae bacterium]